ncbi:MAG: 5'/3'-nucleotidase SurE [Halobacteriales archaeon]
MDILLTNDDGIESTGIAVLYEALEEIGDVTVVAPATDQSAIGRAISSEVAVEEHELGYTIDGTPADCVVAGLEAIGPYPDLVVAGCNQGANLGAYVLGRSGTVSAAVEAAFFGIPAIAVSLYIPIGEYEYDEVARDPSFYDNAIRATRYLADHAMGAGVFEQAEYLNVNAPIPGDTPAPMRITRPSHSYEMAATHEADGTITLTDQIWELMRTDEIDEPAGTDRRAILDGEVSVSPLTAPHTTEHHEALDALAETYLA